jgi:hypothetical protein
MMKNTLSDAKLSEAFEWGKIMEGELEAGMRLLNAFQGLMTNNPTTQTREIKVIYFFLPIFLGILSISIPTFTLFIPSSHSVPLSLTVSSHIPSSRFSDRS